MKRYDELVEEALARVREVTPWDFGRRYQSGDVPLLLDIREPAEFDALRIPGSINVPRGILEQSCEWDYDETVPELVAGREREIVVICRSGKRSVLAADVMQQMGFINVVSLKLGIRGWNDAELPMENANGNVVDADAGDELLASRVKPEQRRPK
ncbi:MAG: rhodanese-like domain-containing protein [Gammaproteobacteria bacterium]|nr:rhodanese-like domain-containing protein [Sideroxydans sp.]MBU3902774.1 rhodanese-like domain-containing protein [Gammaproteobacteria bacterium]MBU4045445.1 rhodanese-like domain-containing protein [Gammaproteobacteria bacterium]MBU4150317.1 rhodanese-like domain-containing protein [Gammaproteobacteria bacterium]